MNLPYLGGYPIGPPEDDPPEWMENYMEEIFLMQDLARLAEEIRRRKS